MNSEDITTGKSLKFNSTGTFRIMHVTDTHYNLSNRDASLYLLEKSCDREKPDMIALTGDIALSNNLPVMYETIDRLMKIFEDRKIPVAVCFGNHDSESGDYTKEELMSYFNKYDCSVSVDEGDLLPGCGTYSIPVMSSDGKKMIFNIWMFDSGSGLTAEKYYTSVLPEQVEWYKNKSDRINEECGEKINSFVFQHIIVPEIYDALRRDKRKKVYSYKHLYNKQDYYEFDPNRKNFGTLHETPCPSYYNYGQFEAMVQKGNVLAIFTGHDHTNAFGVRYKNIDIVNSLSTRYEGESFSAQYGYRMIELNEKDTSHYTSSVGRWYDFFSLSDIIKLAYSRDNLGFKTAMLTTFRGAYEKFIEKSGHAIFRIFAGRPASYPD